MKPVHCIVCGAEIAAPLFVSEGSSSITTMMDVLNDPTIVSFCDCCGHLQTSPLPDLAKYYSLHYQVLVHSEDEDQLVALQDGRNALRNTHQANTLLEKIQLPNGAQILDFGCAKSAVMRLLLVERPDLNPYLFDVTDLYVPFWKKFMPDGQWATHQVPSHWTEKFDLITSFFAMEHVEAPALFMQEIHRLLKPDGRFYCVVPNVYDNVADFVVADHVSHFSAASIAFLLEQHEFEVDLIDSDSHPGAWIFVGRKSPGKPKPAQSHVDPSIKKQAAQMAGYWETFARRVRDFESTQADKPAVIYGSGFYGMYIMTCLRDPERVLCFLDQNPHRQKQRLCELPIYAPEQVPHEATTIYVGLNPRIARSAMAGVPPLTSRDLQFFYP